MTGEYHLSTALKKTSHSLYLNILLGDRGKRQSRGNILNVGYGWTISFRR